jgi:hypothetical protein
MEPTYASPAQLKEPVAQLLGEVANLKQTVGEPRAEMARLKGRPTIKPSGHREGH